MGRKRKHRKTRMLKLCKYRVKKLRKKYEELENAVTWFKLR